MVRASNGAIGTTCTRASSAFGTLSVVMMRRSRPAQIRSRAPGAMTAWTKSAWISLAPARAKDSAAATRVPPRARHVIDEQADAVAHLLARIAEVGQHGSDARGIRDQRQRHQALVGGGRSRLHDVQIGILNFTLDADTRFAVGEGRDGCGGHGRSDQEGDFFRKPRMGIAGDKGDPGLAICAVFFIHTNVTLAMYRRQAIDRNQMRRTPRHLPPCFAEQTRVSRNARRADAHRLCCDTPACFSADAESTIQCGKRFDDAGVLQLAHRQHGGAKEALPPHLLHSGCAQSRTRRACLGRSTSFRTAPSDRGRMNVE